MEWATIISYMREGDNRTTKFFGSFPDSDVFGHCLVAMASTRGGKIILGIDLANYHMVGVDMDQSDLISFINTHCKPIIHVKIDKFVRDSRSILIISIPDGTQKPYAYNGSCFIMDEANVRLALVNEEQNLKSTSVVNVSNSIDVIKDIEDNIDDKSEDDMDDEDFENDVAEITDEMVRLSSSIDDDDDKKDFIKTVFQKINSRQIKALRFLSINDNVRNKQYRNMFDISHKTAHLELSDLVEKGILVIKGSGRSTCYELCDLHRDLVISNCT